MPTIRVNGAELHYVERGRGEPVVFSHGFLFDARMFDAQMKALEGQFRCIAFDHRGQGKSEITPRGYSMDELAGDAEELIRALGAAPCHFVGLSMGGYVGMRLAARKPELIRSLTLLDTSAEREPERNVPKYNLLAKVAKYAGLRLVMGPVMNILFGKKFLTDRARKDLRTELRRQLAANRIPGLLATIEEINSRPSIEGELGRIKAPTLVLVGDQDVSTVPAKAQRIHALIPGSKLVVIPGAGHSSTIEEPDAVNAALVPFITEHRGSAAA